MFSSNTTQVSSDANYIEDVFSTYLYEGNYTARTITNNIDLLNKGGLVWSKSRNGTGSNFFTDTARGAGYYLISNATNSQAYSAATVGGFSTTGYTLGLDANINWYQTYASWTFRKQPKFFDVVTYTRDSSAYQTITHNLGSVPGCIIVKATSGASNWSVYHRSIPTGYLTLNSTNANINGLGFFQNVTSTSFETSIGAAGVTYVAYLFAHNAGGFGLTGSDNVISCGSYTGVTYPGDVAVTLGYEPQWVMVKNTTQASDWVIYDNMRGMTAGTSAAGFNYLAANLTAAENVGSAPGISPTATEFIARAGLTAVSGSAGDTMVYIAIRRGPMKVPTVGTTVFAPALGSGAAPGYVSGFPVDLGIERNKGGVANTEAGSRLTGVTVLQTHSTNAEANSTNTKFDYMNGFFAGTKGTNEIAWMFRRAPSFFDVVCYTGNGSSRTLNHNLGVAPELIITKVRNGGANWMVFSTSALLYGYPGNGFYLNSTNAMDGYSFVTSAPTATTYSVGTGAEYNANTSTYVSYLFATCPGVSKVGSYTGTATTKQVDCGFTGGARFVLIKRTDSTGDWYVWDTARGIVSGNDPYLLLNSTAAEVTSTDYIDTYSAGFELSSTAPAAINANGGTFIFLAIA